MLSFMLGKRLVDNKVNYPIILNVFLLLEINFLNQDLNCNFLIVCCKYVMECHHYQWYRIGLWNQQVVSVLYRWIYLYPKLPYCLIVMLIHRFIISYVVFSSHDIGVVMVHVSYHGFGGGMIGMNVVGWLGFDGV